MYTNLAISINIIISNGQWLTASEHLYNYYKGLFDFRSNSTKKIWSNLNHVCSFKKSNRNSTSIQKLIVSGKEITDVQDIAEELNNYFSNVGQNLVK